MDALKERLGPDVTDLKAQLGTPIYPLKGLRFGPRIYDISGTVWRTRTRNVGHGERSDVRESSIERICSYDPATARVLTSQQADSLRFGGDEVVPPLIDPIDAALGARDLWNILKTAGAAASKSLLTRESRLVAKEIAEQSAESGRREIGRMIEETIAQGRSEVEIVEEGSRPLEGIGRRPLERSTTSRSIEDRLGSKEAPRGSRPLKSSSKPKVVERDLPPEMGRVAERVWANVMETPHNPGPSRGGRFATPYARNVDPDFVPAIGPDRGIVFGRQEAYALAHDMPSIRNALFVADSKYLSGISNNIKTISFKTMRPATQDQVRGMIWLGLKTKGRVFVFLIREGQTLGADILEFARAIGVEVRTLTHPLVR
jgi:hypothetical protein